jgi:hypothetical protein
MTDEEQAKLDFWPVNIPKSIRNEAPKPKQEPIFHKSYSTGPVGPVGPVWSTGYTGTTRYTGTTVPDYEWRP